MRGQEFTYSEAALRELAECLKSEMGALICEPYPHFRKEYCGEITAVQNGGVISVYADYYLSLIHIYGMQKALWLELSYWLLYRMK